MSDRKNYNSIVFLTTLSVYLGLVLVGSTPVLAQAALTRNFDIKNEIVVEDDLDKKPDDEKINFADSLEKYFQNLEYFISDLRKLHNIEKFDLSDYRKFQHTRNIFKYCDKNGLSLGSYSVDEAKKIDNLWVVGATTDAIYRFEDWNSFSDCLSNSKFGKNNIKSSSTEISYDKSELVFKLSADAVSPQRAEQLVEKFNQAFKLYKVDNDRLVVKKTYENTSFTFENNQVFIITRLPRASIDSLLAGNDAR